MVRLNSWGTPQEYFDFLIALLKKIWSPTVFPILPPRENRVFSRPLSCSNPTTPEKQKIPFGIFSAEVVGFELTTPCGVLVFKTSALDHYATPPYFLLISSLLYPFLYSSSSSTDSFSESTEIFSNRIKGVRDFVEDTFPKLCSWNLLSKLLVLPI